MGSCLSTETVNNSVSLVSTNGLLLQTLPHSHRCHKEIVRAALTNNGLAFKYVGIGLQNSYILSELAVLSNPAAYQYLTEGNKILFAQDVIERDPTMIGHVPKRVLTRDLCRIAVARQGRMIEYIPQEMRPLLAALAMETYPCAFKYLPTDQWTTERVRQAVRADGRFLADLANTPYVENKTTVLLALITWPDALECASPKLKQDRQLQSEVVRVKAAQAKAHASKWSQFEQDKHKAKWIAFERANRLEIRGF